MNYEFFIAKKIVGSNKANFSTPIVRLGVVSVALGLIVMIISIAIVTGFQKQIRDKVVGFGSHMLITNFEVNSSYEPSPININQPFYPFLDTIEGISHIQVFATKAGIIKTEDQIEGVILKGIGSDYDWSYLENKIVEGKIPNIKEASYSNDVVISKSIASRLRLTEGDPLRMYFIIPDEMQPRGRKFNISGIYETGLEEFDKLFVIGDIYHIRKLNKWNDQDVGGFEVIIDDFDKIDQMGELVYGFIGYNFNSKTIKQLYPQIFEWLSLQDMNVIVIIALMILISGITMISTLLIIILEKTNMIGLLKAFGSKNKSIRRIFIYNAIYIIGKGLIWGNVIAIGLCLFQLKTGIFKLNQESYYITEIPINLQLSHLLIINIGTLLVCTLILIIPTYIITRISPLKAIRFA